MGEKIKRPTDPEPEPFQPGQKFVSKEARGGFEERIVIISLQKHMNRMTYNVHRWKAIPPQLHGNPQLKELVQAQEERKKIKQIGHNTLERHFTPVDSFNDE